MGKAQSRRTFTFPAGPVLADGEETQTNPREKWFGSRLASAQILLHNVRFCAAKGSRRC